MDTPFFKTLRIAPTTQQGGTQTIQQSIYLTHNNPCGANLLIFQEMGLTQIRYIDLKNYLDDILSSDEMNLLFDDIRVVATEYLYEPKNSQLFLKYIYTIIQWASQAMANLPVSENYYPGYLFRVNVYDGSGTMLFDSYYPNLQPVRRQGTVYANQDLLVLPSNPYYWITNTGLYKVASAYAQIPFLDVFNQFCFETILSNFPLNQSGVQETVMAVSSLLVDSANTRSFGIPKYGFSARQSLSPFAGITYNCSHIIDINTIVDENGRTTLVESIFFRLSLEEDTWPDWARAMPALSDDHMLFMKENVPDMDVNDKETDEDVIQRYRAEKFKEFMRSQNEAPF